SWITGPLGITSNRVRVWASPPCRRSAALLFIHDHNAAVDDVPLTIQVKHDLARVTGMDVEPSLVTLDLLAVVVVDDQHTVKAAAKVALKTLGEAPRPFAATSQDEAEGNNNEYPAQPPH